MKYGRVLRILAAGFVLPISAAVIPGTPALAAPVITLSPDSGARGTMVAVIGANFDSYKGDQIYIFFDSGEITTSPLVVPQTGSFTFQFNIPDGAAPGEHWVRAKSAYTTLALSKFTVPALDMKLDTLTGPVGTRVTLSGQGFYAGRVLTIYYYNRTKDTVSTIAASATGEFSYRFTIPASIAGKHRITAENDAGDLMAAVFEVVPLITLSAKSGAAGEILTVNGTGFGQRSDIGIYFMNTEVAYAKTNENGSFEAAFFNLPPLKAGSYEVKVRDGFGNVVKAEFSLVAGARLDKLSGNIGSQLTVSGTGFTAGASVTIKYDEVTIITTTTDGEGAFQSTFPVPASQHGEHIITVTDGSITKKLVFAVESTPPSVPTLLSPANTKEAKAEATFDWAEVTDPSLPVTYQLQVASDKDFLFVILEKKDVTKSEYVLIRAEKLTAVKKDAPYYWRVKARDGAANESEWSALWSFYVLAPPAPRLLLPESGSEAEDLVRFDWQEVTSLSPPITYHWQLASDKSFTTILLEKKRLTASEYALTEGEKLAPVKKEAPYYWRVKAIDGVANESEWSAPASFYVAFVLALPGWALYTLIGLGAALIGFLAFLFGRKSTYYRS